MSPSEPNKESDRDLWRALFESEREFVKARIDFLSKCTDRVGVIREALHTFQRGTALRICTFLRVEERQQLFDDLLALASVSHSDISLSREVILSLPREWVIANIEDRAEPLLQAGTYEEYRRLLELYIVLDRDLTYRLARRASQNPAEDVREAGIDFMERLKE